MIKMNTLARGVAILTICSLLALGCALEPKGGAAGTSLKFSLPGARAGNIKVHYLLYPYYESTAYDGIETFRIPLDSDNYSGSDYILGVGVNATSVTDSYVIPIEAVPPKRYRMRIHVYEGSNPDQYYWGHDSSGNWVIEEPHSINHYHPDDNPSGIVYVYESDSYFDVIAGQVNQVYCSSVPAPAMYY